MDARTQMTTSRRLVLAAPLAVAAGGGVAFLTMLRRMETGSYDPRGVPSPLIGKRIPDFSLPAQPPAMQGFSSADTLKAGHPLLVNFFASWCIPCEIEQPILLQLKQRGIPIWGIVYKDKTEAAAKMLADKGNPYARLARDSAGLTAINFGVYGVPETYFIDKSGIIRWKWAGPLGQSQVSDDLDKLFRTYR